VARDRKRAKQRQQQRRGVAPAARRGAGAGNGSAGGSAQPLTRADLPGSLEHAGEADEFDAALIRGAGGVTASSPAAAEEAEQAGEESLAEEIERFTAPVELAESAQALEPAKPGELELPAKRGNGLRRGSRSGNGAAAAATPARVTAPRAPAERRQSLPSRAVAFLRASWAELQRVQWPNRAQVTQATAVVIGFVAIAGLYFGLADYVAKEIVEAIL
jgi:preprotein translocase subunit SecE